MRFLLGSVLVLAVHSALRVELHDVFCLQGGVWDIRVRLYARFLLRCLRWDRYEPPL